MGQQCGTEIPKEFLGSGRIHVVPSHTTYKVYKAVKCGKRGESDALVEGLLQPGDSIVFPVGERCKFRSSRLYVQKIVDPYTDEPLLEECVSAHDPSTIYRRGRHVVAQPSLDRRVEVDCASGIYACATIDDAFEWMTFCARVQKRKNLLIAQRIINLAWL